MNDSSTGGPLTPLPSPAPVPLTGQALNEFIQQWIVGITGLAGTLVRPAYQGAPPDIPNAGVPWCAFNIKEKPGDAFPAVVHDGTGNSGNGLDQIIMNEAIDLLCSFYDLGTDGLADYYATLLRAGANIAQNRAYLQAQNFDVGFAGTLAVVPSLIKTRWLYRVDLPIEIRRQIVWQYPVLNVLSIAGSVTTDSGVTVPLSGP